MIDVDRYPNAQTVVGRILRAPLRLIPRNSVIRILQGPLRGSHWVVGSGIHRLWLGSYERQKMELATRFLRPGDTAFDIGANVGIYTLLFSQCVTLSGHVVAFEPAGSNLGYLRRHLSLNGISNATVIEAAVSSSSGVSRFDLTANSSTGRLSESGTVNVRTTTVDDFVAATGRRPALIKIDVEGAELEVLAGSAVTLRQSRPNVLVATHSTRLKISCTEYLIRAGYVVEPLRSRGATFEDELIALPAELGRSQD